MSGALYYIIKLFCQTNKNICYLEKKLKKLKFEIVCKQLKKDQNIFKILSSIGIDTIN